MVCISKYSKQLIKQLIQNYRMFCNNSAVIQTFHARKQNLRFVVLHSTCHHWCQNINCCNLTLSPPIPLRLYTLPYWSNQLFLISDIWVLWCSGLSARAPECQQIKVVGYTSMVLDPLNSSNLEQLVLKGLTCLWTLWALE